MRYRDVLAARGQRGRDLQGAARVRGDEQRRAGFQDRFRLTVAELAGRLDDRVRADRVRALPGGEQMVTDAIRLASCQQYEGGN